jgi:RHS repeat-associated protein
VVSNIAYDALDRRTSIAYPGNPAENVTLTYDQGAFGIGRLTSVVDAAGTLNRTYDERGNMLTESRTHGAATLNTAYTYDAASHLASITYPSRWSVAYSRDKMGRITGVSAAQGSGATKTVVSSVAYHPFGPISALTFGNGITETRSFDPDDRLTSLAATVEKLSYGYDAANNVLSVTDGVNSANSQSFGYDPLNRLTTASGSYGALAYTYDSDGNRLTESSSVTGDGLGSIASFTYNQAGRLASTSTPSQQLTQYTYDAFGNRLVKAGQVTGTTLYQYGVGGPLLEETDGNGNPQVDYIYLNGRPIATIQASNGAIYFLHDDRLGTPQAATDSTQSLVWSTSYQPFGQSSNAPATITQNLRLAGQESDLETGFNHNGFRNYIPALGRYLESDPIGLVGGMNRYAYVSGNPLKSIDPLGLCELGDWLAEQVQELLGPSAANKAQMIGAEEGSATAAALEAQEAFGEAGAAFALGGIIEKDVSSQIYNSIYDSDPTLATLLFPQSMEQFELVLQFSAAEQQLLINPPPAAPPGPSPLAPIPQTGLTVMWNPATLRNDLFDPVTQTFVPWVQ